MTIGVSIGCLLVNVCPSIVVREVDNLGDNVLEKKND